MRKIVKYYILIILIISKLSGQNRKTDSIYNCLKSSKQDSNKVKLLNLMGWEVSYFDLDSGLKYAFQGLSLAKQINFQNSNGDLCNTIGAIYSDQGNYGEAFSYLKLGLENCERYPDVYVEGSLNNSLGMLFQRKKEYNKAIKYYYKAIEAYQKNRLSTPVNTMYGNLAGVFELNNQLDSALIYVNKSIEYNLKLKYKKKLAYNYVNASEIHYYLGNFDKAGRFADLAMNIARQEDDNFLLIHTLIHKGHALNKANRFDESIIVLSEAINLAKNSGEIEVLKTGSKYLSESFIGRKDYKKALELQLDYQFYKDSLFNSENNKIIKELEAKYEVDKKQKENELLQAKNELSTAEIKRQQMFSYIILIGLIMVSALSFFIFNGLKRQRKANLIISSQKIEVEKQKQKIEEHQKEIVDSINYAKKIQEAMLPADSYLKKHIKNKNP